MPVIWLSVGALLIFLGQGTALLAAYFIWVHIAVSLTVYSGFLFVYWGLRNLLYTEPPDETLTSSTVFKVYLLLTATALILNIGRIVTWVPTDKESSLHYPVELDVWPPLFWELNTAFYFMHDFIQFVFLVLIISAYTHTFSLYRKNFAYLTRRIICCGGFFIAAVGLGAILTRILFYSLGDDTQSLILIRTYQNTKAISAIIIPIGFLTPHRVLECLTSPIYYVRNYRIKQQRELLLYLHSKIILIAPDIHLNPALLSESRTLVEISDARQFIWSYVERSEPTTPEEEAQRIIELLRGNTVIEKPGPHIPPRISSSSVLLHHCAVTKHLKRLERGV
jgi:hypothetical protein